MVQRGVQGLTDSHRATADTGHIGDAILYTYTNTILPHTLVKGLGATVF